MSELIAIVYPTEHRAREVVQTLRKLESSHLVELEDARCATKDAKGWVEAHQSINPQTRSTVEITDTFMRELAGEYSRCIVQRPRLGTPMAAGSLDDEAPRARARTRPLGL